MKKSQKGSRLVFVWYNHMSFSKIEKHKKPQLTQDDQGRQSEDGQIRSLQGIFCKGRYRSWVSSQEDSA